MYKIRLCIRQPVSPCMMVMVVILPVLPGTGLHVAERVLGSSIMVQCNMACVLLKIAGPDGCPSTVGQVGKGQRSRLCSAPATAGESGKQCYQFHQPL